MKAHTFIVTATQHEMFNKTVLMEVPVLSASTKDAMDLVRAEVLDRMHAGEFPARPTTIRTTGIRGGKPERFIGWESLTWELMKRNQNNTKQMELF